MKENRSSIRQKIKDLINDRAPGARILLYGSQARGDFNAKSDWDILVVLDKSQIESSDYEMISYPLYELGWQLDVFFSVKLYTKADWKKRSFTPFYKNVENESVSL